MIIIIISIIIIYIYIHICIYVYAYTYVCVCIYIYIYIMAASGGPQARQVLAVRPRRVRQVPPADSDGATFIGILGAPS